MAAKAKRDLTIEEQLARGPMDLPFLMLVVLLTGIGVIMVFSASYVSAYYEANNPAAYFIRQAVFAVMGLAVMYCVSKINYQTFRWIGVFVLILAVVLMLLVLVPGIGVRRNGAQRWIRNLGPIPQFQPSEIAKLGVILFFSARLSKRGSQQAPKRNVRRFAGRLSNFADHVGLTELLPYIGVLLAIVALLSREPHMSATILILGIGAALLFAAGVNMGWFICGGVGAAAALGFIMMNTNYMTSRLQMWKHPESDPQGKGYQALQSLYAIGSGGLLGLGFGQSRQKFLFLPEEHNDFIFSIICEELGYVGAGLILLLFALLVIRGYWLALHARDRFGALLVVGITTLLAFQVFLNIGVVTNLFPVTGIALPFFSYGGSALMIQLAEMGVVLSVSRQIPAPRAD